MKLTFGWFLDGPVAPSSLGPAGATEGEAALGPVGFLEMLETRLGLAPAVQPGPVRVAAFARCLETADDGRRFYSRSRVADPLGTARTLLGWRDELRAGGWVAAGPQPPGRLADLAAAELVQEMAGPGFPDRLAEVEAELRVAGPGLERVRLVTSPAELPPLWRRILALLAERGTQVLEPPAQSAAASSDNGEPQADPRVPRTDLSRLQHALHCGERTTPLGDGSLVFLEAQSDSEAAQALACWLEEHTQETVVVSPVGDDTLDRALAARGLPVAGAAPVSRFRPALQLLPLALAFRWEPLDPVRLMEFLLLPGGPIPPFAASRLAAALAAEPGLGGPEWSRTLDWLSRTGGPELLATVGEWLSGPRFDPAAGMPAAEVLALCARVERFAASRAGAGDPAAAVAAGTATCLGAMVERMGLAAFPRLVLETMHASAAGTGAGLPGTRAERGHVSTVHHPGAILGPVERLVFWDFTDTWSIPAPWTQWTEEERRHLSDAGVELEPGLARLTRESSAVKGAIERCRSGLVLVTPGLRRGKAAGPHPELARLRATFTGGTAACRREPLEWALEGRPASAPGRGPAAAIAPAPLAPPRRWWRLDSRVRIGERPAESYSSLESFLYFPHQWVLRYLARLQAAPAIQVPGTGALLGTLAHRLVQDFLAEPGALALASTSGAVEDWIDARLPSLLATAGTPLLLPGNEPVRRGLRTAAVRSLRVLTSRMAAGGWTLVGAETEFRSPFARGQLEGRLDLLLARGEDERAVIDLKWGGRRRRAREVAADEAMQLVIYAHLVAAQTGRWPRTAYFILEDAVLLPAWALEAQAGAGPAGPDSWRRLERLWEWRRSLLSAGQIEVPSELCDPDEQSTPPELELEPRVPYRDPFRHLLGWPSEGS